MGTVAAEGEIVGGEGIRLAHGQRLLADGKMGRPPVIVFDALVFSFFFDAIKHGLEFAEDRHVPVNPEKIFAGEVRGGLLQGKVVPVQGYVPERKASSGPDCIGFKRDGLDHGSILS